MKKLFQIFERCISRVHGKMVKFTPRIFQTLWNELFRKKIYVYFNENILEQICTLPFTREIVDIDEKKILNVKLKCRRRGEEESNYKNNSINFHADLYRRHRGRISRISGIAYGRSIIHNLTRFHCPRFRKFSNFDRTLFDLQFHVHTYTHISR